MSECFRGEKEKTRVTSRVPVARGHEPTGRAPASRCGQQGHVGVGEAPTSKSGELRKLGVTRLAGAEHTLKRQNWLNVTVFTAKKEKNGTLKALQVSGTFSPIELKPPVESIHCLEYVLPLPI